MALITCPECKKKVSDSAESCPNCGYQLTPEKIVEIKKTQKTTAAKTRVRVIMAVVGFLAFFFIVSFIHSYYQIKDSSEEYMSLARAANEGDVDAMVKVGHMFYKGCPGVKQNYEYALKYWQLAANKGDADAQHNIGVMYNNGEGVAQDYTEALKWHRKAADQGHQKAKELLQKIQ